MTHMKPLPVNHRLFSLVLPALLVASLACSGLTGLLPGASQSNEVTVQETRTFGSGSFTLSDPKAGLSDLSSYTATLTLTFDGTGNGQSEKWSKKYVMLASKESAVRQLLVNSTGIPNAGPIYLAELDGVDYEDHGQNGCIATAIEQGNSLGDRLEPAGFLHYLIGAQTAGSETVNNVAANHYKFDQDALGQQNLTQSTGEVWMAAEGGYVVKYLLVTKAKSDYFGSGMEGTLTWDYELTDIGKPVKIQLPADCPGGMVNVPQLSGASNVVNIPGTLTYKTSTGLSEAAAYYQKQIPTMGWVLVGQPDISDTQVFLNYQQGDQELAVFLTADSGSTNVDILLKRTPK